MEKSQGAPQSRIEHRTSVCEARLIPKISGIIPLVMAMSFLTDLR
ncbi:MAG: hypothetical protein QW486_05755 [Candidatus Bathyarchaeia archaeon]